MAWFEAYEQTGRTGRRAEHGDPAEMHEWALENVIALVNAVAADRRKLPVNPLP